MNPLSRLFELISVEYAKTIKADELAQHFLLCLEGESDIYPFSIIDLENLVEAIDKGKTDRYTGRRSRPDSEYDEILFALMEAWQWLLSKAYIAQKPRHTTQGRVVLGETNYFMTKLGLECISEHKPLLKIINQSNSLPLKWCVSIESSQKEFVVDIIPTTVPLEPA